MISSNVIYCIFSYVVWGIELCCGVLCPGNNSTAWSCVLILFKIASALLVFATCKWLNDESIETTTDDKTTTHRPTTLSFQFSETTLTEKATTGSQNLNTCDVGYYPERLAAMIKKYGGKQKILKNTSNQGFYGYQHHTIPVNC